MLVCSSLVQLHSNVFFFLFPELNRPGSVRVLIDPSCIIFLDLKLNVCVFLSHNLLDSKINTVLSMCQDTNLLNPVHGIVQSVVYHEESPPQYQPSYLQSKIRHTGPVLDRFWYQPSYLQGKAAFTPNLPSAGGRKPMGCVCAG